MAPRIVARQLSRPAGWLGTVIMLLMNRTNARLNAFALEKLALCPDDRVLEIGFGGGLLLGRLIAGARLVCGVDRSAHAVAAAKQQFASAVQRGKAEFREGVVEALPFADGSFDKVITSNTVYFWRSLNEGFSEIHRVLARGGAVVIGFLPKEHMDKMNMPADIFSPRAPDEIIAAMGSTGFTDVRLERPDASTKWSVARGSKQ